MRRHRVSHTAVKIGKGMVYIAQDPRLAILLPDGLAKWCDRLVTDAGVLKSWERRLYGKSWLRRFQSFMERHTMPGVMAHMALRKRFLDDETRQAIRDGATQVLAVGAGLDTLCLRLAAEYSHVTFVEVDHPATHSVKRRGVEAIDALGPNLHLLSADLAKCRLEDAMTTLAPWRRDAQSVVVAEGVLMYLDESAVSRFLDAVRRITGAGSCLLFTYLHAGESGRIRLGKLSWLSKAALRLVGEPLRWGVREGQLGGFLAQHGYQQDTCSQRFDLRARYLEPAGLGDLPLSDIESVGLATHS